MMTEEQIQAIVKAATAGTEWAKSLQAGDAFTGAGPAADARCFADVARSIFIHAALDVLEKHILITDKDGRIVSFTPKPVTI